MYLHIYLCKARKKKKKNTFSSQIMSNPKKKNKSYFGGDVTLHSQFLSIGSLLLRRLPPFGSGVRFAGADAQQFDLKDESAVGSDLASRTVFSVGQGGGDVQLPFISFMHQLQRLGPAFDNTADTKIGRLSSGVRAIELGSVDQGATIVNADTIGGAWAGGSFPRFDDLVLEAARQHHDAFLLSVLLEELLSLSLVVLLHVGTLDA